MPAPMPGEILVCWAGIAELNICIPRAAPVTTPILPSRLRCCVAMLSRVVECVLGWKSMDESVMS